MNSELMAARERIARLEKWVDDLQSGMYINCVYCGHRYGPKDEVPTTMADVLKKHIEEHRVESVQQLVTHFVIACVAHNWHPPMKKVLLYMVRAASICGRNIYPFGHIVYLSKLKRYTCANHISLIYVFIREYMD